jgi:hypothetical protein
VRVAHQKLASDLWVQARLDASCICILTIPAIMEVNDGNQTHLMAFKFLVEDVGTCCILIPAMRKYPPETRQQ